MENNAHLKALDRPSSESENIEYWPITSYTTQRQIEEWLQDEDNSSLNKLPEDKKREFLDYKCGHLGWRFSEYYFKKLGVPIKGVVVEQGAGSFWLSSYLSSFSQVNKVIGVELCKERIIAYRDIAFSLFKGAKKEKITYVVGDMHELNIPDNSVDLVVCDAVLHHADNLVVVLRESYRVLKPGGWFVALREPTISNLRLKAPIFNSRYPEDGTAQYYYKDGWRGAFINGWFTNIRICKFIEYGYFKGISMPWFLRKFFRVIDLRIPIKYYPKICIAAQKPEFPEIK
jgi:SAM-dependent methyltransferase